MAYYVNLYMPYWHFLLINIRHYCLLFYETSYICEDYSRKYHGSSTNTINFSSYTSHQYRKAHSCECKFQYFSCHFNAAPYNLAKSLGKSASMYKLSSING